MEKYYEKVKRRLVVDIMLVIVLMPIAVYTAIVFFKMDSPLVGSSLMEFWGGFINGVRSSIVAGFISFLMVMSVRDWKALKDKEKRKELYIAEHDERLISINEISSRMSFNIILYFIMVAALITGLYDSIISVTLFCVWVFIVVVRIITYIIYSNKR